MANGEEIHSTEQATKNSMRVVKDLPVKDAQGVKCGRTAGATTTLQGQECLVFYLGN
jgi:hypothetical protein